MKILVHALAALETGGSDRHLRGMLASLETAEPSAEYILYVSTAFPIQQTPKTVSVRSVLLRGQFHRLWWDQVVLPKVATSERVGAVWATLSFGMLRPPVPQIVFQRNAMYYCPAHLDTLSGRELLVTRIRRALLHRAMRASRWVITPTLAMRDMIRGVHPELPSHRFEVMPHVSAMQMAFARVKESWEEAFLTNLASHGMESVLEPIRSAEKVGLFTSEECPPAAVARTLLDQHIDYFTAYICENLGAPDER